MKRIILWMLIVIACLSLVSVFSLAGCKTEAPADAETTEAEEEIVEAEEEEEFTNEVTLSISHPWHGGDAHAPFTEWVFKDFQEKYPNIKIDNNEIPGGSYRDKVRSDFMGNVGTDIILWYGGAESYDFVREGLLLDITDIIKPMEDQFMLQTLMHVTFDEKTYGLPLAQNFFAFYLNKDIYADYGFEYPETYGELKEQVKQFRTDDLIPIILPGSNVGFIQHFYSYIANQVTSAGDFEAASYGEGKSYDDPGYVKAAEIIAELSSLGAFDPEVDAIPWPSVEEQFANGEGAMYWAGIWRVGSLPAEMREKMQPILFPEVEGFEENANVATAQTEMAWFINKAAVEGDPDKLEAVKIFLEYFGSNEISQKHLDLTDTIVPINKDLDLSNVSNAVGESVKLVANAELRPFLRYYQSPAQGTATNELTWNLINGRGTVEANLKLLMDISSNKR